MAAVNVGTLPAMVTLTLYQGDDFWLDVTVTDPETGEAVDLVDFEPRSQIRPSATSEDVLAEFTAEIANGNVVTLHLSAVESAKLALGKAAWDVQITSEVGVVMTLAYGSVLITREVTR